MSIESDLEAATLLVKNARVNALQALYDASLVFKDALDAAVTALAFETAPVSDACSCVNRLSNVITPYITGDLKGTLDLYTPSPPE